MIAAALPALVLSVSLSPAKPAALVPVTITIGMMSREHKPVTLEYPTPDVFFVQIRDANGKPLFDSRTGHKPIPVKRTMTFAPGPTRIASFDWPGLSDERRALNPGIYVVHVESPSNQVTLVADVPLAIEPVATIASVLAAPSPKPVTIAGTPERNGTTIVLRDESGTVALSRPLGVAPQGRFVIRGQLERTADGQAFVIDRFAPAAENLDPQATPTPRASATPK